VFASIHFLAVKPLLSRPQSQGDLVIIVNRCSERPFFVARKRVLGQHHSQPSSRTELLLRGIAGFLTIDLTPICTALLLRTDVEDLFSPFWNRAQKDSD